jgi:hypothetical protein
MWLLVFAGSAAVGAAWQLRHPAPADPRGTAATSSTASTNPFNDVEPPSEHAIPTKVVCASSSSSSSSSPPPSAWRVARARVHTTLRRALLTALRHTALRARRAFQQLAAPVPLTFTQQLARAVPVLFSSTVCLHVCVWSAGRLVWVVFKSSDESDPSDPSPASAPRHQPPLPQAVAVRPSIHLNPPLATHRPGSPRKRGLTVSRVPVGLATSCREVAPLTMEGVGVCTGAAVRSASAPSAVRRQCAGLSQTARALGALTPRPHCGSRGCTHDSILAG